MLIAHASTCASTRPCPPHSWHPPMQWHLRHGRRVSSALSVDGTLNEPIPLHTGQRPDPLHALQMPVAISLTPCEPWKRCRQKVWRQILK